MVSQLVNGLCCIKRSWGVYEQNSIVISARLDNRMLIAKNVFDENLIY